MLTPTTAREALADQLVRDAAAHDRERYDEIGRRFDSFERTLPIGTGDQLHRLHIAVLFWDAWIDARNRGWQPTAGIQQQEWPALARSIAADLLADRPISDDRVRARFDMSRPSALGDRLRSVAARLREKTRPG